MTSHVDLTELPDGLGLSVAVHGERTLRELTDTVNLLCDQIQARAERAVVVLRFDAVTVCREWPGDIGVQDVNRWERALRRLERLPAVTIAVAHGTCGGPTLDLWLTADFRIGSADLNLLLPVNDGLLWPGMALYRLVQNIGLAQARRLVLWSGELSGRAAADLGLLDELCADPEQAARTATVLAGRISDREHEVRRQLLIEAATAEFDDALGVHLSACDRELRRLQDVRASASALQLSGGVRS